MLISHIDPDAPSSCRTPILSVYVLTNVPYDEAPEAADLLASARFCGSPCFPFCDTLAEAISSA